MGLSGQYVSGGNKVCGISQDYIPRPKPPNRVGGRADREDGLRKWIYLGSILAGVSEVCGMSWETMSLSLIVDGRAYGEIKRQIWGW